MDPYADAKLEEADTSPLPTHVLKDIKAGERSIQLLVSSKNHLYEAEKVEAGSDSWQVIGAWEEDSLSQLAHLLTQSQAAGTTGVMGRSGGFEYRFGNGKKLGTPVSKGQHLGEHSKKHSE